jgi:hypothetical protein
LGAPADQGVDLAVVLFLSLTKKETGKMALAVVLEE